MSAIDQRNKYCGTVSLIQLVAIAMASNANDLNLSSAHLAISSILRLLVCMSQGHTKVGGLMLRVVDTGHWTQQVSNTPPESIGAVESY